MLILLSPSKTQDFSDPLPSVQGKSWPFKQETTLLAKVLKAQSVDDIAALMSVSPKLAALNYERFQQWNPSLITQKKDTDGAWSFKPAIFAFRGDVYRAFAKQTYTDDELRYMDDHIRIISGLYGLLTPLTYMKPYRLEMGTPLCFSFGNKEYKDLYEFWRDKLTRALDSELGNDDFILNLASKEYSSAIDLALFGDQVVNVSFQVMKAGKPTTVAIFAKRQRGEMASWIVKERVETIAGLREYTNAGFVFSEELSSKNNLVFLKG